MSFVFRKRNGIIGHGGFLNMECFSFDDSCQIQVIKGYKDYEFISSSMFKKSSKRRKQTVDTIIYTDGTKVERISDSLEDREVATKDDKAIFSFVDTLEVEDFRVRDSNYVVQVVVAKEFLTFGNVCGLYDVVKKINFYLRENIDKEALLEAREVLGYVSKFQNKCDNFFSSDHEPILLRKRRLIKGTL